MWAFLGANWGNLTTVLGFAVTLWVLARTQSAAEAAKKAAEATKAQLSRVHTISEFSSAITIMDEIKRLHRARAWELVPDRYAVLCRLLVSIQTLNPDLTDGQRTVLSGAIVQFRTMESKVEGARFSNRQAELDLVRLNRIVTKQLDDLDKIKLSLTQAGI